jgi:glycolate oxidase iron-sulfur subunit
MIRPRVEERPLESQVDDLLTCVHCGFCLASCPTYELLGDERDSPRGRLYLMRAVAEGRLEAGDQSFALHLDQCLGCRACEPVCPSGVRFGLVLEHAREARALAGGVLDRGARLALRVFAKRRLQNLLWALLRLLRATRLPLLVARAGRRAGTPGRLRFAMAMLAATARRAKGELRGIRRRRRRVGRSLRGSTRAGERTPPAEDLVALLEGCVMSGLYRYVNRATERLVRAHGAMTVNLPAGLCCGALHAHAGELEEARALARRVIRAFERSGAKLLLTNSAGCSAAIKDYAEWLRDDPVYRKRAARVSSLVRDVVEWLVERSGQRYAALQLRLGYDAPCHLLHAQRISDQPLALLGRVPQLEVVELPRSDRCCGAAGIYGLARPQLSQELLRRKLAEVKQTGVRALATGNPGCLMQIGAGALTRRLPLDVIHPVELLAALLEAGESG